MKSVIGDFKLCVKAAEFDAKKFADFQGKFCDLLWLYLTIPCICSPSLTISIISLGAQGGAAKKDAKKETKKEAPKKAEKKETPKKEEPEEMDACEAALLEEPKSKDPFDLMPKG